MRTDIQQGGMPDADDRAAEGDGIAHPSPSHWHAHLDANGIAYQHRHGVPDGIAHGDGHPDAHGYGYTEHYPNGDTITVTDTQPNGDAWWRRWWERIQ